MSRKTTALTTIIIILSLLLPNFAAADFVLGASASTVDTCASETALIIVTTTNTGLGPDTYTISLSDDAAKWSVVAPQGFVLGPGESQNSYVYTTPPKNAKDGDYGLTASISSNAGGQQTQSYTITVGDCNSVSVTPIDSSELNLCTCTSGTFEVLVTNSGRWSENYKLSMSGSGAKWATLSESTMGLASEESRSVQVSVQPPCGETGDYSVTVTAESLNSDAVSSASIGLGVDGCYEFDFALSENYLSFCDNSEAKVPVSIQNKGTVDNGYAVSVDGPEWASFDKKKVTALAGRTEPTNLVLSPSFGVVGNFPMTLTVEAENGDIVKTDTFTANVLSCRKTSLELTQHMDSLCAGNEKSYELALLNAGEFGEQYAVSVTGVPWARADTSFITLDSGESDTLNLEISPGVDVLPGEYEIIVEATSQNVGSTSDSDSLKITIPDRDSCFGVELKAEKNRVEVAHGEAQLIPIIINNIGSSFAEYELELSGDGASLAQLNPGVVEVEGNKAETVYLHISAPVDTPLRTHQITVSARNADDTTVSGSTTIFMEVTESSSPIQIPPVIEEPKEGNETAESGIVGKSLRSVSSLVTGAASKIGGVASVTWSATKRLAFDYWHIALIVIGALLFLIIVLRYGVFRKEEDWFEDFEDLFDDEDDVKEAKSAKKPTTTKATKEAKKGPLGKFMNWLTEEDDLDDFDFEYETPKKSKKKESSGAWSKFKDWLEEDDEDFGKPAKKTTAKSAKKTDGVSFASRISNIFFVEVADKQEKKKPKTPSKPAKKEAPKKTNSAKSKPAKKKTNGSAWKKFVDWLYEEDDDFSTAPAAKKAPAKKTTTKKKAAPKKKTAAKRKTTAKKSTTRKKTTTKRKTTRRK